MKTADKNRLAFSMIEIMFAIAAMSMLLIPLYSVLNQGNYGAVQVRHEVVAQQHAANLLSFLNLFPYEHPNLAPCVEKDFRSLKLKMGAEALSLDLENSFTRLLTVQEFTNDAWPVTYKVITVTLKWKELAKSQKELKACCLIFR